MYSLSAVFAAAVDDIVLGRQQTFGGAGRSGLRLHKTAAEEAQIVGLFHRTAVDGRSVQVGRHLVDLLARTQRAADARRRARAHVFLALDAGRSVDRIRVGESDRVALWVELLQIDATTTESLTQITCRLRRTTKHHHHSTRSVLWNTLHCTSLFRTSSFYTNMISY